MPQLDVSWVVSDPMLADCFSVTRRTGTVDAHGRSQPTDVQVFARIQGVVTQQSPDTLMRKEEGQIVPRRIFIATSFALRGASQAAGIDYQPDKITWNGSDYFVEEVLPYSRFGNGTYEVIACTQQATDVPQ